MDDRKKNLEAFIKSLKNGGDAKTRANWGDEMGFNQRLLQARDLSEEALAHEVLKNTGIPIPSNDASLLRKEDFYNRVLKERYPEFEPDLEFNHEMKGSLGTYDPNNGLIELHPKIAQQDIRKGLGTALHEAGHKYDDKVLNYNMPKNLITGGNSNHQLDLDKAFNRFMDSENLPDPSKLYEVAAKGHHAKIPNLREGSFGLGALKSYLKNGNFKSVAGPAIGLGLTAAMMPEDVSASDFIPGLDQAGNAGSAMDDRELQTEVKARQNYDQSQARKDALMRLRNGR